MDIHADVLHGVSIAPQKVHDLIVLVQSLFLSVIMHAHCLHISVTSKKGVQSIVSGYVHTSMHNM